MAYRYNNGYGAVTCDFCDIIIETGYAAERMAKENAGEDVCEECANSDGNESDRALVSDKVRECIRTETVRNNARFADGNDD